MFRQTTVQFLGHEISSEGLRADPAKVKVITQMPRPQNKEEIKTLQGMVGYLAKFLPSLSQVMEPMRRLFKDDITFEWGI